MVNNNIYYPLGTIMCSLFLLVGCTLSGFALWLAASNALMMRTHTKADGMVLKCERIGPESRFTTYSVQVRYEGLRGSTTTWAEHTSVKYEAGDAVTVYYLPQESNKVVLGSFSSLWFLSLMLGAVGAMFLWKGGRVLFTLVKT